jgi:defect-in-organelle-trafficking protein DotD
MVPIRLCNLNLGSADICFEPVEVRGSPGSERSWPLGKKSPSSGIWAGGAAGRRKRQIEAGTEAPELASRRSDNFRVMFSFAPRPATLPSREWSQTVIMGLKTRFGGAALVALSLAGCGVTPVAPNVDTPGISNPEVSLQKSMDETAHEMTRIGAMRPNPAVASQPAVVAGELDRVVSMQWNGPLDGAVKRLGETIGYGTAIIGTVPQAGVNVAVDPTPRRVYDILHGLGDQAGDAATVRVDQRHQVLEVIYHG